MYASKYFSGSFICQDSHRARDCLKNQKLNAIVNEEDNLDSDSRSSQVNQLQLVNAINTENGIPWKDFIYVATFINKKMVSATMDTRASHNFIAKRMTKSLRLKMSEHSSGIKAVVNS